MERPQGPTGYKACEGPEGPRTLQFTPNRDRFSPHVPNWENWLKTLMSGEEQVHCMEVGSCEGRSALWIAENLLNRNAKSRLWCIDTWSESDQPADADANTGTFKRFTHNLLPYLRTGKVIPVTGSSEKALSTLFNIIMMGKLSFLDFAYVAGSRAAADVLSDAILSFHMLKTGGVMIIHDYEWNAHVDPRKTPRLGIDCFLNCFAGRYELLHKGSQVVVKKTDVQEELKNAK